VKNGDWTGCVDRVWCEGFSFFKKPTMKTYLYTTSAIDVAVTAAHLSR
jgi:hypothetical protein